SRLHALLDALLAPRKKARCGASVMASPSAAPMMYGQAQMASQRIEDVVSCYVWHRQGRERSSITALAPWIAFQALWRSLEQAPALLVLPCGPYPQPLPVPDGSLTTAEKCPPRAFCQSSGPGRTSPVPWTTHGVARRGPALRQTADTAAPTPPRCGARRPHS